MSLWLLKWRKAGRTRGVGRRLTHGLRTYLRRYGYVTEWSLQLWRFKRRKEGTEGR